MSNMHHQTIGAISEVTYISICSSPRGHFLRLDMLQGKDQKRFQIVNLSLMTNLEYSPPVKDAGPAQLNITICRHQTMFFGWEGKHPEIAKIYLAIREWTSR